MSDKGAWSGIDLPCSLNSQLCVLILVNQRPTAKELLQHRFIRGARKTSYLSELTERYQDYHARSVNRPHNTYQPSVRNSIASWEGTLRSDWNFDTIRSTAAMGTFSSMAKDIMPPGMIPDENEEDEDNLETAETIATSGATNGGSDLNTRPSAGIGMNMDAVRSTVIIHSKSQLEPSEALNAGETPPLVEDGSSTETVDLTPKTPPSPSAEVLGAPPAYVRTPKRASYAARTNAEGTVVRDIDLGSGVDTIRPVKRVDAAGSLRLSADFVGSMRAREGSSSQPGSPVSAKDKSRRRTSSELVKAGKALVDEVVLPTLERVRSILHSGFLINIFKLYRQLRMIRMLERLNL